MTTMTRVRLRVPDVPGAQYRDWLLVKWRLCNFELSFLFSEKCKYDMSCSRINDTPKIKAKLVLRDRRAKILILQSL